MGICLLSISAILTLKLLGYTLWVIELVTLGVGLVILWGTGGY